MIRQDRVHYFHKKKGGTDNLMGTNAFSIYTHMANFKLNNLKANRGDWENITADVYNCEFGTKENEEVYILLFLLRGSI